MQTVGQSLNFPAAYTDYQQTVYTLTGQYCVRCHSTTADPSIDAVAVFRRPEPRHRLSRGDSEDRLHRLRGRRRQQWRQLRHQLALLSAPVHRQPQLLG